MKKILFALTSLNLGGVEKALLSLLRQLGPDEFEIHLAVISTTGELLPQLPRWVKLHVIDGYSGSHMPLVLRPAKSIIGMLARLRLSAGIPALVHYAHAKLIGTMRPYADWLLSRRKSTDPAFDETFDLAVDFPGPPGEFLQHFVGRHVKAKRKASWIHFDVDRIPLKRKSFDDIYDSFDRIYCVSGLARERFMACWPRHASKTRIFHNIVDSALIQEKSEETGIAVKTSGVTNLLTVARMTSPKGVDLALRALKDIVGNGNATVVWHFVGGGEELQRYRKLAADLGIDEYCRFHGPQVNPYPFIKMCDVYVQPSRHEGYGIAIAEAKVFGMPIVATDFAGATEQLSSLPNAIVIPNFVNEDDAEIRKLSEAVINAMSLPRITAGNDKLSDTSAAELADFIRLTGKIL